MDRKHEEDVKVTLVAARGMPRELTDMWSRIQRENGELDSPFFRPEFALAVASTRRDVEVAVLEESGDIVGFWPFQRGAWNIGKPVGGPLSDFHGLVVRPGFNCNVVDMLRACRLAAWDFHNIIASQTYFAAHHWETRPSRYMDLSAGFHAYQTERNAHTNEIRNVLRKSRKAQREVATLKFVPRSHEPAVFDALIAWKGEQYLRTGVTNIFRYAWTKQLLEFIVRQESEHFSGLLSALYFGDRLVAVHMGMLSGGVLHGWFPAYDISLAHYSPGLMLTMEIAQAAETIGIRRLDMCSGPGRYKSSLGSGEILMARGSIACRPVAHLVRNTWRHVKPWTQSALKGWPAQTARRLVQPLRSWLAFR